MTRKPDLFILGAPKCGTTSLASWLDQHPLVFMSPNKEPNVFNTDYRHVGRMSIEAYESMFNQAEPEHIRTGEATTYYLRSDVAVQNILAYTEFTPKFIVCLRNPLEMVLSWHRHLLRLGAEDQEEFSTAWQLQEERASGNRLPRLCTEPLDLQYAYWCRLGEQVENLLQQVPRNAVLFVFLDDVKADAQGTFAEVLRFLGVEEDVAVDLSPENVGGQYRWAWQAQLLRAATLAKNRLLRGRSLGIGTKIQARFAAHRPKTRVYPEVWEAVQSTFRDDIELLSKLTGRNLAHWLHAVPKDLELTSAPGPPNPRAGVRGA